MFPLVCDRALIRLLRCHGRKKTVLSPLDKKKDVVLIRGLLHLLDKIFHILNRFPVDLLNDISCLNSGVGCRTPRFHLRHHYARFFLYTKLLRNFRREVLYRNPKGFMRRRKSLKCLLSPPSRPPSPDGQLPFRSSAALRSRFSLRESMRRFGVGL